MKHSRLILGLILALSYGAVAHDAKPVKETIPELRAYFAEHKKRLIRACNKWHKTYKAWREANPEKAALLDSAPTAPSAAHLLTKIPVFPADAKHPGTRGSGREILQSLAAELPLLISGSADLHGSTYNYINADKDFEPTNRAGRKNTRTRLSVLCR